MHQVVQVTGAVLILAAFVLGQTGTLNPKSVVYLVLNAIGAATLTVNAWQGDDWGFLMLEGVWTLVSVVSLASVLRGRQERTA